MTWIEPSATGDAVRYAFWDGTAWSDPSTVIEAGDLFVNWADFPSVTALEDGTLVAHWLQRRGDATYAYDARVALSRDGGVSWISHTVLHDDGLEAEHGFVSLVPVGGEVAALWLDGRATVGGDPMTLRFATLRDGVPGPNILLDDAVCDCCQTAMAPVNGGLVAAYRNRTDDETRDIYVARYVEGAWTEGRPVHDDGWVIAGCPVNGPALAARGDRVAVAWFTAAGAPGSTSEEIRAAGERGRALVAFSDDGGATFSEPVRVDDGDAMGRVDLVLIDDGALVSWLERTNVGAQVRIRQVAPEGVGPSMTVAGTEAARASGFPRMVRTGDTLLFAWTEPGEDGGVRLATARLPSTPGGAP